MLHQPHLRTARRIHLMTCDCADCTPAAPSAPPRRSPVVRAAFHLLAGIATGQLVTIAWDAATAGPGAFAVFGL